MSPMRLAVPRWIAVALLVTQALAPLRAYSMALPGFGASDVCSVRKGADAPAERGGAPARDDTGDHSHCAACVCDTSGAPPSQPPSALTVDARDAPVAPRDANAAPVPPPRPAARAPPPLAP
jgi:hypothetical protein